MYIYCTFAVSQNQLCKMKDEGTFLGQSGKKCGRNVTVFRLACFNLSRAKKDEDKKTLAVLFDSGAGGLFSPEMH